MQFQPIKPEEDKPLERSLFPEGEYDFKVVDAIDTQSKAGNDMIKLKLQVLAPDGQSAVVFDYLLAAMEFKLRHFCVTTDMLDSYNSGDLKAIDCDGCTGMLRLKIEPESNGYPAKNVVEDYLKPDNDAGDDGIPF
jgi:hypothetical protein